MVKILKSLAQGLAHAAILVVGIFATIQLMSHSEARMAYGYLVGWWGALYFGYVANITLPSSIVAFFIYFLIGIFAVFLDWSWFYKGLPDSISVQYIITIVIGGVAFVSPIFVNAMVRFVKKKI